MKKGRTRFSLALLKKFTKRLVSCFKSESESKTTPQHQKVESSDVDHGNTNAENYQLTAGEVLITSFSSYIEKPVDENSSTDEKVIAEEKASDEEYLCFTDNLPRRVKSKDPSIKGKIVVEAGLVKKRSAQICKLFRLESWSSLDNGSSHPEESGNSHGEDSAASENEDYPLTLSFSTNDCGAVRRVSSEPIIKKIEPWSGACRTAATSRRFEVPLEKLFNYDIETEDFHVTLCPTNPSGEKNPMGTGAFYDTDIEMRKNCNLAAESGKEAQNENPEQGVWLEAIEKKEERNNDGGQTAFCDYWLWKKLVSLCSWEEERQGLIII